MEPNENKINRTRSLVNWAVAVILALFLILLSYSVLYDLGSSVRAPEYDAFTDRQELRCLDARDDSLSLVSDALRSQMAYVEKEIEVSQEDYDREKESFDTWITTRRTLGKAENDRQVLARTAGIDAALSEIKAKKTTLRVLGSSLDSVAQARQELASLRGEQDRTARERYESAYRSYELKIFGIRLLFALPVLLLGVWFFIRFRHSKYKALFLGFSLYSLYVFFFALVPYLPSFGGYVRYGVGVVLTVALGYYAIKYINSYVERKRAELKQKAAERQGRIRGEVAQRAFDAHVCPSCGRDFYVKPWEYREGGPKVYGHCPYCGMGLYTECWNCGEENFAHFPYCHTCGVELKHEKKEEEK